MRWINQLITLQFSSLRCEAFALRSRFPSCSLIGWQAGGRMSLIGWDGPDRKLTAQSKALSGAPSNARWLITQAEDAPASGAFVLFWTVLLLLDIFCVHLVSASDYLRLYIRTVGHYLNTIFMPHVCFSRGNGKVFQGGLTQLRKREINMVSVLLLLLCSCSSGDDMVVYK